MLSLPYPVSANRYWRSFRSGSRAVVTVSSEAKAYKQEVGLIALQARMRVMEGPVALNVTLVPKNGTVMDLDNCLKVTLDALKGIAYADDKQVRKIVAQYAPADGKGGLLVSVEGIA